MDRVLFLISWWLASIKSHNAIGFFDINKVAEGVALKLLNEIYDYQLENLNYEKSNYPGIDLGDKVNKIGFQITSRKDTKKIRDSLKKFVEGQNEIYTNGILFLILSQEKKPQLKKETYQKIYPNFEPTKHILNSDDLIKKIRQFFETDREKFYRIKEILEIDIDIAQKAINRENTSLLRYKLFEEENRAGEKDQSTTDGLLALKMRVWFQTIGYSFEPREEHTDNHFEWIINIPVQKGYDRVIVHGVPNEASLGHLDSLRKSRNSNKADKGWLVANQRISQSTRDHAGKNKYTNIYCYTFNELLDEHMDFSNYFEWLESEVKRLGIDEFYINTACLKEEFDLNTKEKIGESIYNESNGWLDNYIDCWLDDPSKGHLSIIGEFGTGKTWFALHYAWVKIKKYLNAKKRGLERPRIPIFIPLRDYGKAVNIESLFYEFFFRKHEICLPGYSAFEYLNCMGRVLLIFDGFDEMSVRIDKERMVNNFWELAHVVKPGTKAILTCRKEHFKTAKDSRNLLNAKLKASTMNLTAEPPQFEVIELQKFNNQQIRLLLSFYDNPDLIRKIMDNQGLLDLARRPVMIDLIIEALPDVDLGKPIDMSHIYLYAIHRKMEKDIKAERTFTSLADKLFFLCELTWEMFSKNQMSLNYRYFPDHIRNLFGPMVRQQKDIDHWHYDMMCQTMLIRNASGDYSPAHRSLLEFFVAYKITAELGILADDFTSIARSQSNIDFRKAPKSYIWSEYFQFSNHENGKNFSAAPLRRFKKEKGMKTFLKDLDFLVCELMSNMVDYTLLPSIEGKNSQAKLFEKIFKILKEMLDLPEKNFSLKEPVNVILKKIADNLGADQVGVFIHWRDDGVLRYWTGNYQLKFIKKQDDFMNSFQGYTFRNRKPLMISDLGMLNLGPVANPNIKSLMAIPLVVEGNDVGVISFESYKAEVFSQNDLFRGQTLCLPLSILFLLYGGFKETWQSSNQREKIFLIPGLINYFKNISKKSGEDMLKRVFRIYHEFKAVQEIT